MRFTFVIYRFQSDPRIMIHVNVPFPHNPYIQGRTTPWVWEAGFLEGSGLCSTAGIWCAMLLVPPANFHMATVCGHPLRRLGRIVESTDRRPNGRL